MSHHTRTVPPPLTVSAADRLKRAVWLLLTAVTAISIVTAAVYLTHRHQEEIETARLQARNSVRLLEENLKLVLQSTAFILKRTAEIEREPQLRNTSQRLRKLAAELPEHGRLYVTDATGKTVLSCAGTPDFPNLPLRFGGYGDRRVVVGPTTLSAAIGEPAFTVSRAIADNDNHFAGMAVAAIGTRYLGGLLKDLNLGPAWSVRVTDRSGAVILGLGAITPPLSADDLKTSAATERIDRGADGVERLTAYRPLPAFGIMVTSSIAIRDALAAWHGSVMLVAAALIFFGAMLAGLASMVFHSLDREQATMRGLEEAVRDRTREARLLAEEAWRANETKTRFLAAASHDLRQPLQAAGMFVEVLSSKLDHTPDGPLVDKLRQCMDATGTLLNTLLDVSTLEAGKVQPNITSFPLATLLASLADQIEPLAVERRLRFRVVATHANVVSDPVLLERILRNFLINALRYTSKGGVLIGCRRRRPGELAIEVIDTGNGIPKDKLDAIFEDFVQLDKNSRSGVGLGLGVAQRMSQLLGHRIEVRSTPGHGSTFAVIVPMAPDQPEPMENEEDKAETHAAEA